MATTFQFSCLDALSILWSSSSLERLRQNFLCNMLLHSKGGQNMYLGYDANSSRRVSNINIPFSCSHDVLSFVKPKPQKMPPFNSYSDRNLFQSSPHLTLSQWFLEVSAIFGNVHNFNFSEIYIFSILWKYTHFLGNVYNFLKIDFSYCIFNSYTSSHYGGKIMGLVFLSLHVSFGVVVGVVHSDQH